MKSHCYFLFFLATLSMVHSQNECEDANSDLIYAYSNVKSAYDSNNISHLKYYANRSFEAFERSKERLTKCGCETAYNLAYDGAELLAKVENVKTYEDGRFYVKRARDIGKACIIALDECTIITETSEDEQLTSLQHEQQQLKLQQQALKAKEVQIKAKLEEQEEKEVILKKKQLINTFENTILSNIKVFNETLKNCNCDHNIITDINHPEVIISKPIEHIRAYYIGKLKAITTKYLAQLDACHP